VASTRHWRQRFVGLDGDYIYRKAMNIRGADGKMKRVGRGEPVDVENDVNVARRLKALWYAEAIELADPTQQYLPRKVTTRDNLAARQEEVRIQAREDEQLKAKRNKRRELNALQREAQEQRRLAEQAVRSAEDRERREIEDMIADEERAARDAEVQRRLAAQAESEAKEAESERELAQERVKVAREQEQVASARQKQAEQEAGEERARLDRGSDERRAAREKETAKNVTTFDQRPDVNPLENPHNKSVDAKAQQAEVLGKRASDVARED
jgi:chromosome segregation ATPase